MKKKILIADDDSGILDALTLMLEDAGYEVGLARDGSDISTLYESFHPDLLLLDIWMSGKDGRDICKQLKSQETSKHTPIIMISANKDTQDIAQQCGADCFLEKPFQMDNLLKKIEYLLREVW